MKSIKRILLFTLALSLLVCFAACGDGTDTDTETQAEGNEGESYTSLDYSEIDLGAYVTLGQYKDLEFTTSAVVITADQVDYVLQQLIDSKTEYEAYDEAVTDRAAMAGDYASIDFEGYINGELFEGGSADGVSILLGENNGFIDWLDDDLYGLMPGQTVETTGNFPEDYQYTEYAGVEATFVITLHSIVGHYTIPELTDEFVLAATGYDTVEEYRKSIYGELLEEAEATAEMERYQIMWETVLGNAEIIELPEQQVMYYYTSYRSSYEAAAESYGYTYEDYVAALGMEDADLMTAAENLVKEELVFYSIVKAENITIDDDEYTKGVAEYADAQGMTVEELEEAYSKEYIIDNLLWDDTIYTLADLNTFIFE